jgi:formylglycine-generating enzyme required for sulfatase activity
MEVEQMSIGWELLLGAALEAGLGVLAEAGFGDEVQDLKERLTRRTEKARQVAFERAFDRAIQAGGEERLKPLLEHPPFREAVITGLLDPEQGFDLQAAAAQWKDRLPSAYIPRLRRFFNALEGTLLADETWGPILERFQELRFRQDVLESLEERQLDVPPRQLVSALNAQLSGGGAIAQAGGVAAGPGSVAVGGDVLGDIIQMVVQQVAAEQPQLGPQPDTLRTAYLKRLARECGVLRLLGLDTSAGHAGADQEGDVRLEAVYVHLDTSRTAPDAKAGEKPKRRREGEEMERQRLLSALEAVACFPRLVLTGGPGAGKSTFANYLALCLAVHSLALEERPFALSPEKHLPTWPGNLWPLPVRIVLREFARELPANARRGTADLLWQHIEDRLAPLAECRGMLKEALLTGDALVVLDGFDEVPETSVGRRVSPRRLVLQAVEDFALRAFPDARCLVTCRSASYVAPWTLPKFEVAPLAEFDQEKRDLFCRLWYAELARRGQLEESKVTAKVTGLQQAIRRPDLARMAGNPLLLTVMALVHAREPELPEARALLYERCVDVLLWLWERRKEEEDRPADLLTLLQEAGVDRTFFVRAMDRLAYDVHHEGGAQAGEADIRASVLERRLEVLHPERDPAWARRVATFIRERAGLLVERRADEVDPVLAFPHRTFQEYLAACWLTEGEDTAHKAAKLAREGDHWWEVVKLAAGRLLYVERKVAQPLALLDWLCPERKPADKGGWRLARLAGEVLLELKPEQMLRDETARPQVVGRLDRVRRRLVSLLEGGHLEPRERAAAGNTLAQLDDPRFREDAWYLPDEPVLSGVEGPLLGFVEIAAGPFIMGSDKEQDRDAYDDELPQHTVELPRYYMARYPVTHAQYWAFVQTTGHEPPYEWQEGQPPPHLFNHPVVLVTWYDAVAYCRWLTEQLRAWESTPGPLAALLRDHGWQVRLPTEAEWEKAARGADGLLFPWGGEPDSNRANYDDTGIGATSAAGCFPGGASPYGCLDMSGNVWEWTHSLWGAKVDTPDFKYPYDPKDGREDESAGRNVFRVLRGGAFLDLERSVRCASRYRSSPFYWDDDVGFRVVVAPGL